MCLVELISDDCLSSRGWVTFTYFVIGIILLKHILLWALLSSLEEHYFFRQLGRLNSHTDSAWPYSSCWTMHSVPRWVCTGFSQTHTHTVYRQRLGTPCGTFFFFYIAPIFQLVGHLSCPSFYHQWDWWVLSSLTHRSGASWACP